MYQDDYSFQKALFDHKVYSAWQFIQFTRKNIETVKFCFSTINSIIEELTLKTIRWEQDLFNDFEEIEIDGKKAKKISVTNENQPSFSVQVAGNIVNSYFIFDKLIKDFFQYSMNSFDSISQIANAGLLANREKKVDTVDFQNMNKTFLKQTYQTAFPLTSNWFNTVYNSNEFKYIEAINNRTKHTFDVSNKLAIGILGSGNQTKIGPFFRKDVTHGKRELIDQLSATLDFIKTSWNDFLSAFSNEFILDQFIENRFHNIDGVYEQSLKDEKEKDYSYAYITTNKELGELPEQIQLLLAVEITDEDNHYILSHDCPFKNILIIKGAQESLNVIGRYYAEEELGEDCLNRYRKYTKDDTMTGVNCLFSEMINKDNKMYHKNPFFDVIAMSDDESFLFRTSLEF